MGMHERYNLSQENLSVLDEQKQIEELSKTIRHKMIEGIRGKTFTLLNTDTLKSGEVTVLDSDSYMDGDDFVWTREDGAEHGAVHSLKSILKSAEGLELLQSLLEAEFVSKNIKQEVINRVLQ